jgi:hypothetical protein
MYYFNQFNHISNLYIERVPTSRLGSEPMQSVPIITNVVSLNPVHGKIMKMYLIHYCNKDRQFSPQPILAIKLTATI